MQKSTKAALYSAFILPGAGLLWLKQYWSAAILMTPAIIAAIYIFRITLSVAQQLAEKISNGSLPMDSAALSGLIVKMMSQPELYVNEAKWVFIICWGASIALSYFAGKKKDSPAPNIK